MTTKPSNNCVLKKDVDLKFKVYCTNANNSETACDQYSDYCEWYQNCTSDYPFAYEKGNSLCCKEPLTNGNCLSLDLPDSGATGQYIECPSPPCKDYQGTLPRSAFDGCCYYCMGYTGSTTAKSQDKTQLLINLKHSRCVPNVPTTCSNPQNIAAWKYGSCPH